MKAVVWKKYGDSRGLVYQEVPKPEMKQGDLLIKIHATTVSTPDL